jgi:hypothetical protein
VINFSHAQVPDRPNPLRELMLNGVVTADNEHHVFIPPTPQLMKLSNTIDEINIILNYCYQHAYNANPVQELVNQGLVSSEFSIDTCASIKQKYDNVILIVFDIENQIREKGCYGEGCTPNFRPIE